MLRRLGVDGLGDQHAAGSEFLGAQRHQFGQLIEAQMLDDLAQQDPPEAGPRQCAQVRQAVGLGDVEPQLPAEGDHRGVDVHTPGGESGLATEVEKLAAAAAEVQQRRLLADRKLEVRQVDRLPPLDLVPRPPVQVLEGQIGRAPVRGAHLGDFANSAGGEPARPGRLLDDPLQPRQQDLGLGVAGQQPALQRGQPRLDVVEAVLELLHAQALRGELGNQEALQVDQLVVERGLLRQRDVQVRPGQPVHQALEAHHQPARGGRRGGC